MILDTLQMVADALNDPIIGVMAQIPTIPTGSMTIPVVQPQVISDESRRPDLATNLYDGPYPAVLVAQAADVVLNQRTANGFRDADMTVNISYRAKLMPQETATLNALLVMRAIHKTIEALFQNTNESLRIRHGVQLIGFTTLSQSPTIILPDDSLVVVTLNATMQVRDINL